MAIVIGDIHGCLSQLNHILEFVNPDSNETIITLGDYIDRGPDTKGVIDRLIELGSTHNLAHLKGNHDVFMEEARSSDTVYDFWVSDLIGGSETLASYGGKLDNVPNSHWEFLNSAKLYYELAEYICVHGGVDADVSIDEQDPEVLLNKRFQHASSHVSGKTVICGHTRQIDGVPKLQNSTLCIDTNVFDGGYLTAFDTNSSILYQVNADGESKSFNL